MGVELSVINIRSKFTRPISESLARNERSDEFLCRH